MKKMGRPNIKRKQIIETAMEVFINQGVRQTKVKDIARAGGHSHAIVSYHFKTIDEIFSEVILIILGELKVYTLAAIEGNKNDPIKLLESYLSAPFLWGKENPRKIKLWIYFYYVAIIDDYFKTLNDEIRKVGRERIHQILYQGMAKGVYVRFQDINIEELSANIQGLITGNFVLAVSEKTLSLEEARENTIHGVKKLVLLNSN